MEVDRTKVSSRRTDALYKAIAEGKWPQYWFGPTGRGKTFAAALIYADWSGWACFWPAAKIVGDIQDAQFNKNVQPIINTVESASLIVVDDIVDRNMTDARCAALCDLINWRKGKPLILTGNFNPDELTKCVPSDRLVSRILSGKALAFQGPDMRLAKLEVTDV